MGIHDQSCRKLAPPDMALPHAGLSALRFKTADGITSRIVFFHIANTLLLFLIFNRMTNALWQSAFVAALFALHPLHVESVAWVAERKDVLSTFFWMLTMGAYIYYVERPGLQRYLVVLLFFVSGPDGKTHAGHSSLCPAPSGLLAPSTLRSKRNQLRKSGQR